jgi:predicted HAD superfamily Cof-like phosphohydrolase
MNMSTEAIELWHKRARPEPTAADFNVQLGCHFEEIQEMGCTIEGDDIIMIKLLDELDSVVSRIAHRLKVGLSTVEITDRKEFLDSIADQVVTGVGAAYCAGMKAADACERVNTSNWSKFDHNGQPIRDANGKIKKGPNYQPPVLDGLY